MIRQESDKMAIDLKYGEIDIPGVPDDMPVFILLAKDVTALSTIERYEIFNRQREINPATDEWLQGVENVKQAFRNYATVNPDEMHVPD